MQRFVSWNLSDFGIFGNSMCLRITKTLRPKFLSASGFQPNSKLVGCKFLMLMLPVISAVVGAVCGFAVSSFPSQKGGELLEGSSPASIFSVYCTSEMKKNDRVTMRRT